MPSSAVAEEGMTAMLDARPKSAPHHARARIRRPSLTDSATKARSELQPRPSLADGDKPLSQYARKKLPWIEAHERFKQGQSATTSKMQLAIRDPDPNKTDMVGKSGEVAGVVETSGSSTPTPPPAALLARHSVSSLGGDPSLRATGSTPSLRRNERIGKIRTMSLSSEPRKGIRHAMTMQRAKAALLGEGKAMPPRLDDTSPSEYSTTLSTTSAEQILAPPSPPPEPLLRKGPASYEQLLMKSPAMRRVRTQDAIPDRAQELVKNQHGAPLASIVSRSEKRTCRNGGADSDCTCSSVVPLPSSFPEAKVVRLPPKSTKAAVASTTHASRPPYQGDASLSSPSAGKSATGLQQPTRIGTTVPKPPPRTVAKMSLFPMPTHMMESSSHSTDIPSHLRITTSSSDHAKTPSPLPLHVKKSTAGPPAPVPAADFVTPLGRSATVMTNMSPKASTKPKAMGTQEAASPRRDLRRETRTLNKAVTGLENLMEEAITAAEDASEGGKPGDVAYILDSAAEALRATSSVAMLRERAETGRKMKPLRLSEHESGPETDSDITDMDSTGSSLGYSQNPSYETLPTLHTKSAQSSKQPLVADPYLTKEGRRPVSYRAKAKHSRSLEDSSDGSNSMTRTPPRLYQPPSADSIVKDFAYNRMTRAAKAAASAPRSKSVSAAATDFGGHGAASDYYGDQGQSVAYQPGVRPSVAQNLKLRKSVTDAGMDIGETKRGFLTIPRMQQPQPAQRARQADSSKLQRKRGPPSGSHPQLRNTSAPQIVSTRGVVDDAEGGHHLHRDRHRERRAYHPHMSDFFANAYYRIHEPNDPSTPKDPGTLNRSASDADEGRRTSGVTDERPPFPPKNPFADPPEEKQRSPRNHVSLRSNQTFSLGRYHRRQPIAREWHDARKRWTAMVVCGNTVFVGLIAGIYAGEVPRMQYQLFDKDHHVILGNVLLFLGLGLTTLIAWPLPLLHGRKPYTLVAFGIMIPLQFPQALAVTGYRDPANAVFRCGLLIPRVFTGIALGFANVNILPTLLDLFGCSLMSERPHQEIVTNDDVRRQGGGMGIWLGLWSFCFVGSLSIGFCIGACIISKLGPQWGFYIVVILLAFFMAINVLVPEPRRAPYRRSIAHYFSHEEKKTKRRVARGEVKLHISNDGPKWWHEEVWAGLKLTTRMVLQPGFFVLMCYIGWVYAQVTMVILLQGALLSRDYHWPS